MMRRWNAKLCGLCASTPLCLPALVPLSLAGLCLSQAHAGDAAHRCRLWLDLCRGEPIPYEAILADLATARVVYLGEHHTIAEHHDLQARLIADLGKRRGAGPRTGTARRRGAADRRSLQPQGNRLRSTGPSYPVGPAMAQLSPISAGPRGGPKPGGAGRCAQRPQRNHPPHRPRRRRREARSAVAARASRPDAARRSALRKAAGDADDGPPGGHPRAGSPHGRGPNRPRRNHGRGHRPVPAIRRPAAGEP